jgi:peptidoglycan/xylan/chitin deacetylase (PgdA/CDA1 family)
MTTFAWPRGARAAISLTYDDALATQREHAAPALHARGLPGTFFLTGDAPDLAQHDRGWQQLLGLGHELASHTMHHPCDCSHDWVPRGYTSQDYTLARMSRELDETLALLRRLGAPEPFSFAYPCGETTVGAPAVSYRGLVATRFVAGRGVAPRLADPEREALDLVSAHDGARPADELIALVDAAEASGGWLVLIFHGVGGDHIPVDLSAHDALLDHLALRRDSVWAGGFGCVAEHVRAWRARHAD